MPESANRENVRITENSGIKQTTPPQPKPRKIGKQTTDENKILQSTSSVSESSSDEEGLEESNVTNTEHIYASIDPNTKSPKKSSDSEVGNTSLGKSPSQETVYSEPWNSQKTLETLEKLMKAHPTPHCH